MSDTERDDDARRRAVEEQAIAWFSHMRAAGDDADHAELEKWLEQSAEHRRAYEWASRHFETAALLKMSRRHGRKDHASRPTWMIGLAIAAAMILAIALGATFRSGSRGEEANAQMRRPPVMRAPPHQIRNLALADGSKLTLDADSRVEIAMTRKERRLRLIGGKARIAVKADSRPFILEAGPGEVSAQVARFDVGLDSQGQIELAVLSGDVELRSLLRPAMAIVAGQRVLAGQSIGYAADSFRPIALASDGIDDRDWPQGWVEYSSVPLRRLVEDSNRYARRPIILDDPSLGDLLVSGRFQLTETDRFAERIAELFDLVASRRSDGIHLRNR